MFAMMHAVAGVCDGTRAYGRHIDVLWVWPNDVVTCTHKITIMFTHTSSSWRMASVSMASIPARVDPDATCVWADMVEIPHSAVCEHPPTPTRKQASTHQSVQVRQLTTNKGPRDSPHEVSNFSLWNFGCFNSYMRETACHCCLALESFWLSRMSCVYSHTAVPLGELASTKSCNPC